MQKPSYHYSTATWNLTVVMICNRLLSPLLSHADKLETCVRYIGGMLDEVIKVGHEVGQFFCSSVSYQQGMLVWFDDSLHPNHI